MLKRIPLRHRHALLANIIQTTDERGDHRSSGLGNQERLNGRKNQGDVGFDFFRRLLQLLRTVSENSNSKIAAGERRCAAVDFRIAVKNFPDFIEKRIRVFCP